MGILSRQSQFNNTPGSWEGLQTCYNSAGLLLNLENKLCYAYSQDIGLPFKSQVFESSCRQGLSSHT